MRILVVGGGGREHAIVKKLKENKEASEIFVLPGNGGIADDAICVDIGASDIEKITEFAIQNKIDYAVVAPDDPLVLGCVDALETVGIPCFGPCKSAAIIEGSKVFAKNLMKKYGIPTAAYETFSDIKKAHLPARCMICRVNSFRRTAARCFSMRWRKCPFLCRQNFCASCKSAL